MENALKERSDSSKQFELLRGDIERQCSTFTVWQQQLQDEHAEETKTLKEEISSLRDHIQSLKEEMMQQEIVISAKEAAKAAAEANIEAAKSQVIAVERPSL
jgi:chromosome segregation ATPase